MPSLENFSSSCDVPPPLVCDKYSLSDLIDLKTLKSTLEKYSLSSGFTLGLISWPDQNLVFDTGWQDICARFKKVSPHFQPHRRLTNEKLTENLFKLSDWNLKSCACGLIDATTPIIVRGRHLADLVIGQIILEDTEVAELARLEANSGVLDHNDTDALIKVPVVTEKQLQLALDFLSDLAVLIAEQGLAKLRTIEKNNELENLLREHNQLTSAVTQTQDAILITDVTGTIIYANPAFEKITGFTKEEIRGKTPRIIKSDLHGSEFYEQLWKTLKDGTPWLGQITNKRKDGTLFTEKVSISPMRNSAGNIESYVAVKRDITREIELEKQLRQVQRMESVGQLAGGIAHDFNNLLQVIDGNAALARDHLSSESNTSSCLEQISEASDRARILVSQLLAFSRRQIIQPIDLNINTVILGLMKMIPPMLGSHIELKFLAEENLCTVHTDQGQMEQVMMNLCVNARDAMPHGGKLIIETRNVVLNDIYGKTHPWVKPGSFVQLSFNDSGTGIADDKIDHIFDPFFTTKEAGKGTGLGLATVYGIVKQNGGHIQVYSEVGKGSVFNVYLPIVERTATEIFRKTPERVRGGNETILLAEDDELVLNLVSTILTDAGYKVLTATNGKEVLKLAEKNQQDLDLAILDVIMPEMGGNEASQRLGELLPELPVLFTSGYSENGIHTNFIKNRDLNLLQKPFPADNLLLWVRKILN